MGMTVACLIPAWNESARLPAVLDAVIGHPLLDAVLVVDDGSTDATAAVARRHGAQVLTLSPNGGKSAAVAAGLSALPQDIILLLDADLAGLTPDHVTRLLRPVLQGRAAASISLRSNAPLFWRLIGLDYISGERAMPARLLRPQVERIARLRGFGLEVFLNTLWLRQGGRIAVVPFDGVASPSKRAKHGLLGGIAGDLRMLVDILRTIGPRTVLSQIRALRAARLR